MWWQTDLKSHKNLNRYFWLHSRALPQQVFEIKSPNLSPRVFNEV